MCYFSTFSFVLSFCLGVCTQAPFWPQACCSVILPMIFLLKLNTINIRNHGKAACYTWDNQCTGYAYLKLFQAKIKFIYAVKFPFFMKIFLHLWYSFYSAIFSWSAFSFVQLVKHNDDLYALVCITPTLM